MRLKSTVLIALVFFVILGLAFPYDSLVRHRLAGLWPSVRYDALSAAPWGVRLQGVRVPMNDGRVVLIEEARVAPAGLFPPAIKFQIKQGPGRIDARLGGFQFSRLNFHAAVQDAPIQEFVSGLPAGLRLIVNADGSGAFDGRTRQILQGSRFSATASGDWSGISGLALVFGNILQEGKITIEMNEGAYLLKEIHVKADNGAFDGTGEIRPTYPLKSATLILKGQAQIGAQTLTIDKSIPIADILLMGS